MGTRRAKTLFVLLMLKLATKPVDKGQITKGKGMYKIYIFLKKKKSSIFSLWASYSSATVLGNINASFDELCKSMLNYKNIANVIFWLWTLLLILFYILYWISETVIKKHNPSVEFLDIMNSKSAEILHSDKDSQMEFSWGYNKNIHRSKSPTGWKPSDFWVSEYDNNSIYRFPRKDKNGLPGYTQTEYMKYCNTDEMKKCRKNGNDMDRFAVCEVIPNFNNLEKRVQIKIKKTKWSALQFHWNYLRLLDNENNPINKSDAVKNVYKSAFLNSKEQEFMINSFCLHLILEDSKGRAILSRISSSKANDYASTWAATIGEQLILSDFYDDSDNSTYPDFITRWTKRALEEEFDISENDITQDGNELDDYVNMDSLRILSVDMEGDIYNIALTAVIKLNKTVDELTSLKGITIDSEELTELKACTLDDIRKILLGYPENSKQYHPSTYLRLLMFYVYKRGIKCTCSEIYNENNKLKK